MRHQHTRVGEAARSRPRVHGKRQRRIALDRQPRARLQTKQAGLPALIDELERLARDEELIRSELVAATGRSSVPAFARLEDVERALAPNEALISFVIGLDRNFYNEFGGGATVTVTSRGDTRVFRVPDRLKLDQAVFVFRGQAEGAEDLDAEMSVTFVQPHTTSFSATRWAHLRPP